MNFDNTQNAQKSINLIVILGILNLILMCFNNPNVISHVIFTFPGIIIRGTFALSYYLGTNNLK